MNPDPLRLLELAVGTIVGFMLVMLIVIWAYSKGTRPLE